MLEHITFITIKLDLKEVHKDQVYTCH